MLEVDSVQRDIPTILFAHEISDSEMEILVEVKQSHWKVYRSQSGSVWKCKRHLKFDCHENFYYNCKIYEKVNKHKCLDINKK